MTLGASPRRCRASVVTTVVLGASALPLSAQSPRLFFQDSTGITSTVLASAPRGYATVPAAVLAELGWTIDGDETRSVARLADSGELLLEAESPFVVWEGQAVQLASATFVQDDVMLVPLQLLVDFLPAFLPTRFRFDEETEVLSVLGAAERLAAETRAEEAEAGWRGEDESADPPAPTSASDPVPVDDTRVVVIDPGHGGNDPGTRGLGGTREKNVVLAVGLALAEVLAGDPDLEVHLIRDRDVLIPLWERGDIGTSLKADRPGVFISLHVNASPGSSAVRGFETYFLAEARTEHARRIAAVENAQVAMPGGDELASTDPDLDFILRELRTFDHEHWSALLAEMVQTEIDPVHPGPNRGVKQAPLAVLTNALMPSVLVELGYVTNRQEERLLGDPDFHTAVAASLATAIRRFFERYPTARVPTPGPGL